MLTMVRKVKAMQSKRCFWNTCPLRAGFFPDKPCALGKASVEDKNSKSSCEWHINSPEDNFCFWAWVRRNSDAEGIMAPLPQHAIRTLLNLSPSKINLIYKEALEKMQKFPEYEELRDVFGGDPP